MARSELHDPPGVASPHIDALTPDDTAGGLALSDAAGWNQTREDWAFFIGTGRALGIRDEDGRLVATAASLGYGRCAWISLVLVAATARHRGLASALLTRCMAQIERSHETPVLDATPAGAEVYGRLGFVPGFAFDRWEGPHAKRSAASRNDTSDALLDRIAGLDAATHGLDRRGVLASFLARPETHVRLASDGQGFVVARAGRRAWQCGPLVASDERQAAGLLGTALDDLPARPGDRVVVDIPSARHALADALTQRGFAIQRSFVRMTLGHGETANRLSPRSFALAGPEYG